MKEKTIIQKTFLGLKWKVTYHFKDNGVQYHYYDRESTIDKFFEFYELDLNYIQESKVSQKYYLLVWSLFWIYGIFTWALFFIAFFCIFMYLYYQSILNTTVLWYNFIILNDKKTKNILEEIKVRKNILRKKNEYTIFPYSNKESEIERLKKLQEDDIISKEEFHEIEKKLQNYNFSSNKYEKEKNTIKKLLKQRGIEWIFELQKVDSENKSLPWGLSSISWEIVFSDGIAYKFWLDWDKDSIDSETWEKWYYTLWDSLEKVNTYWKNFFVKIKHNPL